MMGYRYKSHVEIKDIGGLGPNFYSDRWNGHWDLDDNPELETFMTFDMWLTLFTADEEGWYCFDGYDDEDREAMIPFYFGEDKKMSLH